MSRQMALADFDYIESTEILSQISSAQVLWADHRRICAGPGATQSASCELSGEDKRAINRWLVAVAGVLSQRQCAANPVNDTVRSVSKSCVGHRPLRYGRSAIVETQGLLSGVWPLLDIKGCGVADSMRPMVTHHGTGVVGMGRAFRELFLCKVIETLFGHLCPTVRPVGILAVISLGIKVKLVDHEDTACILVREPHLRPAGNREVPERRSREMKMKIALEAMLMNFGLSSAWKFMEIRQEGDRYVSELDGGGAHPAIGPREIRALLEGLANGRSYEFGLANIQLCRSLGFAPLSAEIVDLEHFFFRTKFDMDIWFPAHGQPLSWGYLCGVGSPKFIQPSADLLSRTIPLLFALGGNRPIQEAGFAQGLMYEESLRRGTSIDEVAQSCCSLITGIEKSIAREVFDDVVEIQGSALAPRDLWKWALDWAEGLMRDPWPVFLQSERQGSADH